MKTIQFFVGSTGVDEVTVGNDQNKMYCTCDGFRSRKRCKHIAWCENQFTRDNFPIQIDKATPDFEVQKAKESDEAFRYFLMRFGKIEVV